MNTATAERRTYTLRNAASVVFALTAVLPLLLFTYTLYSLDQLRQGQAQLGLGAALCCALVGLLIFSRLTARLSELLRFLEDQGDDAGGRATTTSRVTADSAAASSDRSAAAPDGSSRAAGIPAVPGRPLTPPPSIVVPGLGTITATRRATSAARRAVSVFDEVQKTMWQAEAQQHLGGRVLVSVKNAPEPLVGTLAQIAEDGVLLEQGDERVAVSYLRITNIEPDGHTPDEPRPAGVPQSSPV